LSTDVLVSEIVR